MIPKFSAAAAAAAMILLGSLQAEAAPVPALPVAPEQPSLIVPIAGGCGLGWHRGPWGGCRRNWGPVYRRCWFRPTPWGPRRVCAW
ncbi:GCG_CRPN prefix-to-repeats domain-containing protein [Methylocapsa acidiphila]|uniref:GCG_CRPN prefix-to-repeats domain-containing protein n=1 Tax=Methylocapsa acidiphila TaxID=133552 RepID=UPI000428E420|nr:hypothetical protein [Methylocapsa acidiphila]